MRIDKTLSKKLTAAKDGAVYDAACKRLLANKSILAWILKECVEEYSDCSVNDIAKKYIEGSPEISSVPLHRDETEFIIGENTEDSSLKEGTVTYDIRFRAFVPKSEDIIELIINIEAQNNYYPGYPLIKRGIYYCSRMISSQYGTIFSESHYDKIKKVYSIWICTNPPKKRMNTIMRYRICEDSIYGSAPENHENYDLMSVIMFCLGKSDDENSCGAINLLNTLMSSDIKAEDKKNILENDFKIEITKELESEVSVMCNVSVGILEEGFNKGFNSGMEEGIKEGIKEGMEKGMEKGKIEILSNLINNMNWSLEQALSAAGISEEEKIKYSAFFKKSK